MESKLETGFPTHFRADLKNDTGLEFSIENMNTYVQYVNARFSDISSQITAGLTENIILRLGIRPSEIRQQVADMVLTHDAIKELVKHKS